MQPAGKATTLRISRRERTAGTAPPAPTWALVAAAWAALFALPSFYWALGGDFATGTIAADVEAALGWAAEPWALLLVGLAKLLLAAFALSFGVIDLGLSRRWHANAGKALGGGLVAYGILNLTDHALMLTGATDIPPALGESAAWWHALFWDPYWILGGVLLTLAASDYRRSGGYSAPTSDSPR
jgi:hypothetical protein